VFGEFLTNVRALEGVFEYYHTYPSLETAMRNAGVRPVSVPPQRLRRLRHSQLAPLPATSDSTHQRGRSPVKFALAFVGNAIDQKVVAIPMDRSAPLDAGAVGNRGSTERP
jgi:hypothetical protein